MKKNGFIVILFFSLICMIYLYFFKPRTVFLSGEQTIVRDTIYKIDTVYKIKIAEQKSGNATKEVLAPTKPKIKDTANIFKDVDLSYKIIPSENSSYGYEILMNGRLYIHQPTIPGLPGNTGFKNRETAISVADLVISKIRKKEMPPSVTFEELKQLNALE